jgi:small-conductance mechanosensitive channel
MDFLNSLPPSFIPLAQIAVAIGVLVLTWVIASFFRRAYSRYIAKASDDLQVNITQYVFLKHLITGLIYIFGVGLAIYLIEPLRNLSLSLFAGSGILAVIIGFASQHSLANIVSGIFITIFKPFRVGDRVKLSGKEIAGTIEDITLRHTLIRTYENKRVVVPNSIISTEVIENSNMIDEKICRFVEVGISYSSDIDKAMTVMREEAMKHPNIIDARSAEDKKEGIPMVIVRVLSFGESSVNLRAYVWAKDQPSAFQMGCDLNKAIKERFDEEGVVIPFPQRDLHLKSSNVPLGNELKG